MIRETGDFLANLQRAEDIDDVWACLFAFAAALGFEDGNLGCAGLDPVSSEPMVIDYRNNFDRSGFEDYIRRGLFRYDPLFRHTLSVGPPAIFHTASLRRALATPEARALLDVEGMDTKPMRVALPAVEGAKGEWWSVSLRSHHRAKEAPTFFRQVAPPLWLAASAACLRLIDLSREPSPESPLTPRERECLLRLARGDRVDRIADRLSLSNATVEMHLAGARRHLGARTSPEAVAKAVMQGFIRP